MKIDLIELLSFFDELLQPTEEERGIYWLDTKRSDGLIITFAFSISEAYVHVIVHNISEIDIATVSLKNCSEIRILDQKRKCLEILHSDGTGRCFMSLSEGPILEYTE